ncbi:MAG TPA: YdeI/OmpD-associated family protein [Tabrizicola sp.]|nr:YdeI/OmpD-associated family protein [Tabrizicola sp.]
MIETDRFPMIEAPSAEALWRWLEGHHAQEASVWLVTWLKRPVAPYLSREAVLDALLAWGWIDGIRRAAGYQGQEGPGEGRTMQLISPRRHQRWTATYRARAERLIVEGRMAAPGLAAIKAAKAAGTWEADQEVDALEVPEDLGAALGNAREVFDAFPPSHRRNVLRWIAGAKTAPTRAKWIGTVVELAREGKRVPQF